MNMDLQRMIDNELSARRADEMKTSPQLTLGELILKLEAIGDKELPVVFDEARYFPTDIDSWRGSYCELALGYDEEGEKLSLADFLKLLKETVG